MEYPENAIRLPISPDVKGLEIFTDQNGRIILTPLTETKKTSAAEVRGITNGKFEQFYKKNAVEVIREERANTD